MKPTATVTLHDLDRESWEQLEEILFPSPDDGATRLAFVQIQDSETLLKIQGDITMAELKEGQFMDVTAEPKTRRGHKAAIEEGSAVWESSDEDVVIVEESDDDELTARVTGIGVGEAMITLKADGKRGVGEMQLIGILPIVVTEGDAVVFDIKAGEVFDEETEGDTGNPTDLPADPAPVDPAPVDPAPPVEPGDETPTPIEPAPPEEAPIDETTTGIDETGTGEEGAPVEDTFR